MRDAQKNRVYTFEDQIIAQFDKEQISAVEAQDFVNFIWANEGRNHPPKIKVKNGMTKTLAHATREDITLSRGTMQRWVLIHELTHSILRVRDDDGDILDTHQGHGKEFVAKYFYLLEKYLKLPSIMLMAKAKQFNVKWR